MQIREVAIGARRPVERLHVRDELDQITGHETARESQVPEDVHEQPARVAAGARAQLERLLGRLHAGLHADRVGDLALQTAIDLDEKVDGPHRRLRTHRVEQALHERPRRLGGEVRLEVLAQDRLVAERKRLRFGLQEEVERIAHGHVGDEIDLDDEVAHLLRKNDAREEVAVRILLPVQEVAVRARCASA